jgi:hypothetical protein
MDPSLPSQFRHELFSIFKEQCTESIKFLGVLRQTPSSRCLIFLSVSDRPGFLIQVDQKGETFHP